MVRQLQDFTCLRLHRLFDKFPGQVEEEPPFLLCDIIAIAFSAAHDASSRNAVLLGSTILSGHPGVGNSI